MKTIHKIVLIFFLIATNTINNRNGIIIVHAKNEILKSTPTSKNLLISQDKIFNVQVSPTVLSGSPFDMIITLAPLNCKNSNSQNNESSAILLLNKCKPWSPKVFFNIKTSDNNITTFEGSLNNITSTLGIGNGLSFKISKLVIHNLGQQTFTVKIFDEKDVKKSDVAPKLKIDDSKTMHLSVFSIPPFLSVLPPIITLILAVITKQVIPSLFVGIWSGAFFNCGYNPIVSFCNTFSIYFVDAMALNNHTPVVLFALVLGGVLELVDKSGGATGLAKIAQKFASTRFRALLIAWGLSMFIFFDDYSCILIVGATLKPTLRKVKVSPAKLAFIIHIVGVNLPSIIPVSSWVGVELGYIQDQYTEIFGLHSYGSFSVFLRTLPYRFFPLLSILIPLISILIKRDLGALLQAENDFLKDLNEHDDDDDGKTTGVVIEHTESNLLDLASPLSDDDSNHNSNKKDEKKNKSEWCGNAVIPFSVIIIVTFIGIITSGTKALDIANENDSGDKHYTIIEIVANADSVNALLWSSAASSFICIILFAIQSIMDLDSMVDAWTTGFKDMMSPILILLLAWALGSVINDLHTSVYLSSMLQGNLPPEWLVPLATILAA